MRRIAVAVIALFWALSGAAQEKSSPIPALLHDFAERPGDSPLVRAAKQSLALRRNGRSSGWVVNDTMVRHLHGEYVPATSQRAAPEVPAVSAATQDPVDRQAIARKIQAARQEMLRMAQESDEPYGGDISEDRVQQRMSQLPGEIDTLNKQLNPPPPPSPPSPRPQ
jgi:hypothetical protein